MVLSREEKENMVLDLYYNKGYTYKQLTRELRMSPNQIREIIKRHEEKNDAIVNKKKMLSLSSQAYKLFSEGKNNVQVAINLDLPQEQITQFRLQYWRLRNQDKLEQLYMLTKGKVSVLWKIYKELIIIGGLTIEQVVSVIRYWSYVSTVETIQRTGNKKRTDHRRSSCRGRYQSKHTSRYEKGVRSNL